MAIYRSLSVGVTYFDCVLAYKIELEIIDFF